MDKAKLKVAEASFLLRYPGGFAHPEMLALAKKHKVDKMKKLAQDSFAVGQFADTGRMIEAMGKVVGQSSLVSVFEKPKFRDLLKVLGSGEREDLVQGLKELLHGDQKFGFELMTRLLTDYKLAKWPLITVFLIYYRPATEVFIKPTTVKGIIEYFDLDLKYGPSPTYGFYQAFRAAIMDMKKEVDPSLQVDNAAFCGFLMMAIEQHQTGR